jgi:hypothetical protein
LDQFKIRLARIERLGSDQQAENVRVTFEVERATISFQVPIVLACREFDDTEVVKVARSHLHATFKQLADQCNDWRLTGEELQKLADMNVRSA